MERQDPGPAEQSNKSESIFDDDELDDAIANADDTGMIAQQQVAIKSEEAENL